MATGIIANPAFITSVHYRNGVVTESSATLGIDTQVAVGLTGDFALPDLAGKATLTVGVGKQFATIAAAIGAAHDGDTILVDHGTYINDFATIGVRLTLIGVGGMVNMVATIPPTNRKGILTTDADTTIRNFAFSGSTISEADGANGAGVRYEGGQLVLQNCSFTANQNGVMGAPVVGLAVNTVTIDHCVFDGNGGGTGNTHNVYIGNADSVVATNSVFANANVGHEFKSRALSNTLTNNVFVDGPTATPSYDIDLPNGGVAVVANNVIEKGPNAENNAMVHFGGEGIPYPGSSLLVEGNSFIDDKGVAIAVLNQTPFTVSIVDNSFTRMGAGAIASGPAKISGNFDAAGTPMANTLLVGVIPGSTAVFIDDAPHSVNLDGSLMAVQGGAGHLTVSATVGHVIAIGGSGGMDFTEATGMGAASVTTAAGSTNTIRLYGQDMIDSEGNDVIYGGVGNLTGQVNGVATVHETTGTANWAINGTARFLGAGGSDQITLGATGLLDFSGPMVFVRVQSNGGRYSFNLQTEGGPVTGSFTGGGVDVSIYGGALMATTTAGPTGSNVQLGTGLAHVVSQGADIIHAGSGDATVIMSGSATLYAGTGQLAVYGRGIAGMASFYGNGGSYTIAGDTGNITYYGGAKASTVTAMLSHLTLVGGAGRLNINGGSVETIIGGAGGINLVESEYSGANTITTAAGSINHLSLTGADRVDSWGTDTIAWTGGNQVIDVHANATLTAGSGNSYITLRGLDTLNGGSGNNDVTVTSGAIATIKAVGWTTVHGSAAMVRMFSTAAGVTTGVTTLGGTVEMFTAGDGAITASTAAGQSSSITTAGGNSFIASSGADAIRTGLGSTTITSYAGSAEIWAGAGNTILNSLHYADTATVTLHGGAGSVVVNQYYGRLNFIGGTGSAIMSGGAMTITGGSGSLQASAGGGGMNFTGGTGNATLSMGNEAGSVTFGRGNTSVDATAAYRAGEVFRFVAGQGGGQDVITGFVAGLDRLVLAGVSVQSQAVVAGSASIVLSDNTHLTLAGVTSLSHLFG